MKVCVMKTWRAAMMLSWVLSPVYSSMFWKVRAMPILASLSGRRRVIFSSPK